MTEQQKTTMNRPAVEKSQQAAMGKMMRFQMIYMMVSIVTLIVIFNETIRNYIGVGMSVVLLPTLGFHYQLPIFTIIVVAIVIGLITSIPRYFFTDWIQMGRIQNRMRAFNKVYSQAMRSQQKDKVQKMQKMRMEMSIEQSQLSMNQMKPLMVLTIFTLLLFAWIYYFVIRVPYQIIAFPWDYNVNIATAHLWTFPYWFIADILATSAFGYLATSIIKYFDFSHKLRKAEKSESYENHN